MCIEVIVFNVSFVFLDTQCICTLKGYSDGSDGYGHQRKWEGTTSQSVHVAESSDTRPFTCDHCGCQFTVRIGLVGHIRIHKK